MENGERGKNVRVLGVKTEENEVTNVAGTLAEWTQKISESAKSLRIDEGRMLRLRSVENRVEILRGSGKLKGDGLSLEEDATEREELV